jgi:diguanylate cyclase (GGDEF)-like protein
MSRARALALDGLTGTLVIAVIAIASHAHRFTPPHHGRTVPWIVLALMFYGAEAGVVHVHIRRETHSFSLSEIALVLGLLGTAPIPLLLAQGFGAAAALVIHRHQHPRKLAFNLAQFGLATSTAVIVFHALAPSGSEGTQLWSAAIVAAYASALVGMAAITLAIAIAEGRLVVDRLPEVVVLGLVSAGVNTTLGLIGGTVLREDPDGWWLLLVPSAALFLGYRAYLRERAQRQSVEFLYDAMLVLQHPDVAHGLRDLLTHVSHALRAETAELTIFPIGDEKSALRVIVGPDVGMSTTCYLDPPAADPELATIAGAEGVVLHGATRDVQTGGCLIRRRLDDAVVVALPGTAGPLGYLLLGNRADRSHRFTDGDRRVLLALASHVAVALEHGHLEHAVAQLRELEQHLVRQTLHDQLTDLANRTLFVQRVEETMYRTADAAVLFIDLDDFKRVNDTLGHSSGDDVLRVVAARLRRCLRPGDLAARLGGDEFAVIVEGAAARDAGRVAARILDAIGAPIRTADHDVTISASVGIALGLRGDVAAVIDAADAAMYRAKAAGKGSYVLADVPTIDLRVALASPPTMSAREA